MPHKNRGLVNPPVASHNALYSYLMNELRETTGTNRKCTHSRFTNYIMMCYVYIIYYKTVLLS
jgi:hypothetical protein